MVRGKRSFARLDVKVNACRQAGVCSSSGTVLRRNKFDKVSDIESARDNLSQGGCVDPGNGGLQKLKGVSTYCKRPKRVGRGKLGLAPALLEPMPML